MDKAKKALEWEEILAVLAKLRDITIRAVLSYLEKKRRFKSKIRKCGVAKDKPT